MNAMVAFLVALAAILLAYGVWTDLTRRWHWRQSLRQPRPVRPWWGQR